MMEKRTSVTVLSADMEMTHQLPADTLRKLQFNAASGSPQRAVPGQRAYNRVMKAGDATRTAASHRSWCRA